MQSMLEMLRLPFMQRALLVGTLAALCAALLGVSLVLKRYSMIGDGLSHVGFGALAIAAVTGIAPLRLAIPVVLAAAFGLLVLTENSRVKGDSAIAMISAAALSAGVMIVSLSGGGLDLSGYMFGSILALKSEDTLLSVLLCCAVLALYALCYHQIFAVTFDEAFSAAIGVRTGAVKFLLAALTAVTTVLGMRLMGTLLISSLIVFPALSAMQLFRSFGRVTLCAACVSVLCFGSGMLLSCALSTPAGASVVCVNAAVFVLAWLCGRLGRGRK